MLHKAVHVTHKHKHSISTPTPLTPVEERRCHSRPRRVRPRLTQVHQAVCHCAMGHDAARRDERGDLRVRKRVKGYGVAESYASRYRHSLALLQNLSRSPSPSYNSNSLQPFTHTHTHLNPHLPRPLLPPLAISSTSLNTSKRKYY